MKFEFDAEIKKAPDMDGEYVEFQSFASIKT
jgi:hypothetical protein